MRILQALSKLQRQATELLGTGLYVAKNYVDLSAGIHRACGIALNHAAGSELSTFLEWGYGTNTSFLLDLIPNTTKSAGAMLDDIVRCYSEIFDTYNVPGCPIIPPRYCQLNLCKWATCLKVFIGGMTRRGRRQRRTVNLGEETKEAKERLQRTLDELKLHKLPSAQTSC